jgi:hypothetical protein
MIILTLNFLSFEIYKDILRSDYLFYTIVMLILLNHYLCEIVFLLENEPRNLQF